MRVASPHITVTREANAPMPRVDAVGLAVDDLDIAVVYAKRVGADLRHRRFHALADRGDAGDDLDRTVRFHFDFDRIERPQPALFHEHGDAGADLFAGGAALVQLALQIVSQPANCSALSSSNA